MRHRMKFPGVKCSVKMLSAHMFCLLVSRAQTLARAKKKISRLINSVNIAEKKVS